MTPPIVALILCLVHASLVAAATIVVRACLARRFAASRTAVGAVGMTCILLVTALAFVRLPGVWPSMPSPVLRDVSASGQTHGHTIAADDRAAEQSPEQSNPTGGVQFPLAWLRHAAETFSRATFAADAAPTGWKRLWAIALLCGIGVGAARLLVSLCAIRRLYRASSEVSDESIVHLASDLRRRCGLRRPVQLRETAELAVAATCGWLQPVILLPLAWRQWSQIELAAALAHELAHVRRGDYLQRLIAQLGATVHFYNPLVLWSARSLAADQECAADRLAQSLQDGNRTYVRGLALLAQRYHDSFADDQGRSSVSIMPKSSDFLAWRLEMLQTQQRAAGTRAARFLTCGASGLLLLIAVTVTLLRVPGVAAEPTAKEPEPPIRTARRTDATPGAFVDTVAATNQAEKGLFSRTPFDISIIPHAEDGAFLIRVADLLHNPELRSHVADFNVAWTNAAHGNAELAGVTFDLREIDWVAGSLKASVKGPTPKSKEAQFMLGSGFVVFRMTHARDWQALVLKHVAGATLETVHGKAHVLLPVLPAIGPQRAGLRFPDDKTIVVDLAFTREIKELNKLERVPANDDPLPSYAWANAWRAVDGGLITFVSDNRKIGWSDLPEDTRAKVAAALVEKPKYYAIGCDWTDTTQHAGIRMHGTCEDQATANELFDAASALQAGWATLFPDSVKEFEPYRGRVQQFISSVRIEASPDQATQPFVQAKVDVPVREGELLALLRMWFK